MRKKNKSKIEDQTHQPHDKLVKNFLSNPDAARDILSLYLPEELLKIINLEYLKLQKDSFIDDKHRTYAVDLLYKTKFEGKKGYVWILLEHQRKSEYWMPIRIFKYIGLIWDHIIKTTKSKTIPLVYPLIIYNGDTPYRHSLNLSDLIKPKASKELFATLFTKPFSLIDLPSIKDESLREAAQDRVKGAALLTTLKHVFDKNLQSIFDQLLINMLKRLDQQGDTNEVVDIVYYLLKEAKFLDNSYFLNTLYGALSSETEDKIMTIAQQLEKIGMEKGMQQGIQQGMQQGMTQGMQQGIEKTQHEIAARLLDKNESVNSIAEITGLPLAVVQELKQKHH